MTQDPVGAAAEVLAQARGGDGATPAVQSAFRRQTIPALSPEALFPSLFNVKPREVIIFSRQLATLIDSGVSLVAGLELLYGQASGSRAFRRILGMLVEDLGTGSSLSEAMSRHPTVFNEIYWRTIAVGERAGRLENVLRQLAEHQEKSGAAAKKLKGALTYPFMIMGIGIVVVFILTTVALPPLTNMFTQLDADLPLPTRILMGVSGFTNAYMMQMMIVGVVFVVVMVVLVRQPAGRRVVDRIRMIAPVIGPPGYMGEMARFCRTVSMLVGAGLPLQEIMTLIPQTTSNSVMQDALHRVREGLMLGQGVSGPMAAQGLFPPLLIQMVTVGEESNSLESTLAVVADFYETSAEDRMNAMVGILTPAVTIGVSLITGFIALSVIMPMYSITGSF